MVGGTQNRAGAAEGFLHPSCLFPSSCLHRLVDDVADGFCCLPLHPLGRVGVGVQREACAVVSQSVGQGFHVYTVLQ